MRFGVRDRRVDPDEHRVVRCFADSIDQGYEFPVGTVDALISERQVFGPFHFDSHLVIDA